VRCARAIEEAGFDAISMPEHLALSLADAETMGARWPDALTSIGYFAGKTERVVFVTSVLILPLHPVLQLAKAAATLDVLTDGRLELGVGVSIFPQEYALMGVPFAERGAIADEYLEAMRELWTAERPSFSGRYVSFDDLAFEPRSERGGPPIWVGGNSPAARRRAARFGGWLPWQFPPDELERELDAFRAESRAARPDEPVKVCLPLAQLRMDADHRPTAGSGGAELSDDPDELLETVRAMQALGVTDISVPIPSVEGPDAYAAWLERFGATVIAPARA
jgi:probable F420-dependent oxidoreductase